MKLPARVKQIIRSLYDANIALARGSDDQRRQLVMLIAQQTRFELGANWGTKRADKGRPPSKDAIALLTADGKMLGWDLIDGTTRVPFADPNSMDMSAQVFIDVSPGVDHLKVGTSVPPVVIPPVNPPSPTDLDIVLARLDTLERSNNLLTLEVADLKARLASPVRTSRAAYHDHVIQF